MNERQLPSCLGTRCFLLCFYGSVIYCFSVYLVKSDLYKVTRQLSLEDVCSLEPAGVSNGNDFSLYSM